MLYVLEGCDGSGKTTIANHLKQILPNAQIIHCTTETTNDYDFFLGLIEASKYMNLIADRFCYGQFVYQEEQYRQLDWKKLEKLEAKMLEAGVSVIYVTAPVDELEDRLTLRGESTEIPVRDIHRRYTELFKYDTLIKPYVWNTGRDE
jgi:thymidylate kinase